MDKVLYLEKRGCDFFNGDDIKDISDVGNYRVCTPTECVRGKDNRTYFLEFTSNDRYKTRCHRKSNPEIPLKNPVRELIMKRAIFVGTQYTDEDGFSWRNSVLERMVNNPPRPYTIENILSITNEISSDHYTKVEFVN